MARARADGRGPRVVSSTTPPAAVARTVDAVGGEARHHGAARESVERPGRRPPPAPGCGRPGRAPHGDRGLATGQQAHGGRAGRSRFLDALPQDRRRGRAPPRAPRPRAAWSGRAGAARAGGPRSPPRSTLSRLLPTTASRRARKRGSPGFGVSASSPRARPRSVRAPPHRPRRARRAAPARRAPCANVVGSGTVGTGGDRGQVVADDVGEREAPTAGRRARAREAAALEARQVLAHRVQLVDGRAGPQQERPSCALSLERDAVGRRGQQRRGAAREQHQQQVVAAKALRASASTSRRPRARARPGSRWPA